MKEQLNFTISKLFEEFKTDNKNGRIPMFKDNNNFEKIEENIAKLSKDILVITNDEDECRASANKKIQKITASYDKALDSLISKKNQDKEKLKSTVLELNISSNENNEIETIFNKKEIKKFQNEMLNAERVANVKKYNYSQDSEQELFKLKIHMDEIEENYINIINKTNLNRNSKIYSNNLQKDAKNLLYTKDKKKIIDNLKTEISAIHNSIADLEKTFDTNVLINKKAVADQTIKFNNLVNTANKQNKETAEKEKLDYNNNLTSIDLQYDVLNKNRDQSIEEINNKFTVDLSALEEKKEKEIETFREKISRVTIDFDAEKKELDKNFFKCTSASEKRLSKEKIKKLRKKVLSITEEIEESHNLVLNNLKKDIDKIELIKNSDIETINNEYSKDCDILKAEKEKLILSFENKIQILRINHLQILEKLKWQTSTRKETYDKALEHLILNFEFDKKELQRQLLSKNNELDREVLEIEKTSEYNNNVNKRKNEFIRIKHLLFIEKNKHLNTINNTNNQYYINLSKAKKEMLIEIEDNNLFFIKNTNEELINYYNKIYKVKKEIGELDFNQDKNKYLYNISVLDYDFDSKKELLAYDFNNKLLADEKELFLLYKNFTDRLIQAINVSFKSTLDLIESTASVIDNTSFYHFFNTISLYYTKLKSLIINHLQYNLIDIVNNRIKFETGNKYLDQEKKAVESFNIKTNAYSSNIDQMNEKISKISSDKIAVEKSHLELDKKLKFLKINRKNKEDHELFQQNYKDFLNLNAKIKSINKTLDKYISEKEILISNNEILRDSYSKEIKDIKARLRKDKAYYFKTIETIKKMTSKYDKEFYQKLTILSNYLRNIKKLSLKDSINKYFDTSNELKSNLQSITTDYLLKLQRDIIKDNTVKMNKIKLLQKKNQERLKNNFENTTTVYNEKITRKKSSISDIYYCMSKFNLLMKEEKSKSILKIEKKYALINKKAGNNNKKQITILFENLDAVYYNREAAKNSINNEIKKLDLDFSYFISSRETSSHIKLALKEKRLVSIKKYKLLHYQVNKITDELLVQNNLEKSKNLAKLNNEAVVILKEQENQFHEKDKVIKKLKEETAKKKSLLKSELENRLKKIDNKKSNKN